VNDDPELNIEDNCWNQLDIVLQTPSPPAKEVARSPKIIPGIIRKLLAKMIGITPD
jgi:hypothetical protein